MDTSPFDNVHHHRLAEMIHTALAAGQKTLEYFGSRDLNVISKADDSPVTIADREAESLVRKRIAERFPDDAIAGEEHDDTEGTSGYRWIVDPIDGTKSFICGVPLYSTLLAVEYDDQPLGGVIVLPALSQMVAAAIGMGCFSKRGDGDWQTARTRVHDSIDGSVFVVSQVDSFAKRGAAPFYDAIESQARITRTWGDGYGYAMVATGRADIMIDPVCSPWDVAPILPILKESGGVFTDWKGMETIRGGDGIGCGSAALHAEVLKRVP